MGFNALLSIELTGFAPAEAEAVQQSFLGFCERGPWGPLDLYGGAAPISALRRVADSAVVLRCASAHPLPFSNHAEPATCEDDLDRWTYPTSRTAKASVSFVDVDDLGAEPKALQLLLHVVESTQDASIPPLRARVTPKRAIALRDHYLLLTCWEQRASLLHLLARQEEIVAARRRDFLSAPLARHRGALHRLQVAAVLDAGARSPDEARLLWGKFDLVGRCLAYVRAGRAAPLPLEDLLAAPDRPLSAEELAELGPSPTDRHDGSTSGAIEVTDPEEDRLVADVDLRELELDWDASEEERRALLEWGEVNEETRAHASNTGSTDPGARAAAEGARPTAERLAERLLAHASTSSTPERAPDGGWMAVAMPVARELCLSGRAADWELARRLVAAKAFATPYWSAVRSSVMGKTEPQLWDAVPDDDPRSPLARLHGAVARLAVALEDVVMASIVSRVPIKRVAPGVRLGDSIRQAIEHRHVIAKTIESKSAAIRAKARDDARDVIDVAETLGGRIVGKSDPPTLERMWRQYITTETALARHIVDEPSGRAWRDFITTPEKERLLERSWHVWVRRNRWTTMLFWADLWRRGFSAGG